MDINKDILTFNVNDYINISWKFNNTKDSEQYMICRVKEKHEDHIIVELLFSSDERIKRFKKFRIDRNFFDIMNQNSTVLSSLDIVSFKTIKESEALSYGI